MANPRADATASTFARVGAPVYLLLIVYASLYPFAGWRDNGIAPYAFLQAPLPYYWTFFDALTNIIGYVPLGTLVVFSLYPRVRGLGAVAIAVLVGILLSGAMEATQTYLPTRVASNLDLYTNASGTLIGAVAGMLMTPFFLEQSRFLSWRREWFLPEAGRGLIVAGLWPLAQIYPQGYLFGHGQVAPILSGWMSDWLEMSIDIGALLRQELEFTIERYWMSEALITATGMVGATLLLSVTLRKFAPRRALMFALLAAAIIVKSLASALQFAPHNAFAWMTPGAQSGLVFGCAILFGLSFAPPIAQRRIAAAILMIGLFVVNAMPENPYFANTLQTWVQGRFLNFNGAAQFLSLLWPFLALWFLLHPAHRRLRRKTA